MAPSAIPRLNANGHTPTKFEPDSSGYIYLLINSTTFHLRFAQALHHNEMSRFFASQPNAPISFGNLVFGSVVLLITLPYHRFFLNNTLQPVLQMQDLALRGILRHSHDREKLHAMLTGWRSRKKDELGFVSIAVSENSFSAMNAVNNLTCGYRELQSLPS